jgi:murein DD-endopeptidase MepM/ murein hydrolase activator NlpD
MQEFQKYSNTPTERKGRAERAATAAKEERKKKETMPRVMLVQSIVCAVLVLTALGLSRTGTGLYKQLCAEYIRIMSVDMSAREIWSSAKSIFSSYGINQDAAEAGNGQDDENAVYADHSAFDEYESTLASDETTSAKIEEDAEITTITSSGGEDIKVLDALMESSFAPVTLSVSAVTPVYGKVTSGFGYRENPIKGGESFHTGIDIAASKGTRVAAAYYGVIVETGCTEAKGNYIVMSHGNGVETMYCHLNEISVVKGTVVRAGETIGRIGSTGWSTGPHLHFELRVYGIRCNPAWVLTELT